MTTPISKDRIRPFSKDRLRQYALDAGFDVVGFAPAALGDDVRKGLYDFLDRDFHGDMDWLKNRAELRRSPDSLWPEAKSVIVVGHNYGPDFDPMRRLEQKDTGVISAYALNRDYHEVMKKKLRALTVKLREEFGADGKFFVDTAPVMEKPLAARAGLGWQGKHTCLVSREFGSWLFLGEIFTSLAIEPDEAEANHCGSCTNCLDICPTHAFDAPGKLDARKCISYLTIEHKGHIARNFREAIGNRIYGCDDCLAVCPWNKFAQAAHEISYQPRAELLAPSLETLAMLDDAAFRTLFSGSPVKRLGRHRFVRNVLIAIGNSANPHYIPVIKPLIADESPLVRAMAVWALSRLLAPQEFLELRAEFLPNELDSDVLEEWNHGKSKDLYHTGLSVLRKSEVAP